MKKKATASPHRVPARTIPRIGAGLELLLLRALCGSEEVSIDNALEAVAIELEVLYEALKGEPWAGAAVHQARFRVRMIAEIVQHKRLDLLGIRRLARYRRPAGPTARSSARSREHHQRRWAR